MTSISIEKITKTDISHSPVREFSSLNKVCSNGALIARYIKRLLEKKNDDCTFRP
jgi:hypothetical protein